MGYRPTSGVYVGGASSGSSQFTSVKIFEAVFHAHLLVPGELKYTDDDIARRAVNIALVVRTGSVVPNPCLTQLTSMKRRRVTYTRCRPTRRTYSNCRHPPR